MFVSSLPNLKNTLKGRIVTVFGGTGFIGARVVAELLAAGARVRVATRHTESVYFLRQFGEVGQVVAIPCSYRNQQDIEKAVAGSEMVVNCIGILYEKRKSNFSHIHTDLPVWIAGACAKYGVSRFVHISALSVDRAKSEYAISKMSGENGVIQLYPAVTILRPSVVFGQNDSFINKFASMARILPFLPLFGGGKSKFQPVYVEDVARAVVAALATSRTTGQIYELGGPDILTFKQIYQKILSTSGQHCYLLPVPWWIARIKAAFLGLLPKPPLTNDQLTSLQTDNVVSEGALTLGDLGITSTSMDAILPSYLGRYQYKK
ncbi:MAG: hypothetical protein AUJ12_03990 [Alphaproteobacteria bacterium CG1_02_46_17]|nr:MAG: hypothetical protein AUJ12_03990 [Alphaproteobacteria bacterium CG1_02_46_17]